MKVVDLFCGAGGFSQGAKDAGAEVVMSVECDPRIANLYRLNFDRDPYVITLSEATVDGVVRQIQRLDVARGEALHIHGSPPCQALSRVNTQSGSLARGMVLVKLFLKIVERCQPASWSMEQVNHIGLRDYLTQRGISFTVIDAVDFGVPQNRKRLIAGPSRIIRRLECCRGRGPTVLPADVLSLKQQCLLMNATDNVPVRARGSDGCVATVGFRPVRPGEGARSLSTPSHTIIGKPNRIYDQGTRTIQRKMTLRECASLQGFPNTFLTGDKKVLGHKVIGNAVPPPVACAILRASLATDQSVIDGGDVRSEILHLHPLFHEPFEGFVAESIALT